MEAARQFCRRARVPGAFFDSLVVEQGWSSRERGTPGSAAAHHSGGGAGGGSPDDKKPKQRTFQLRAPQRTPSDYWQVPTIGQLQVDQSGEKNFRLWSSYHVYQFHHGCTKSKRAQIVDKRWRLHKYQQVQTYDFGVKRNGVKGDVDFLAREFATFDVSDGGCGAAPAKLIQGRVTNALDRALATKVSIETHILTLESELKLYSSVRDFQQLNFRRSAPGDSDGTESGWAAYLASKPAVYVEFGLKGRAVDTKYLEILGRQREGAEELHSQVASAIRELRAWKAKYWPEVEDDDPDVELAGHEAAVGAYAYADGDPFASTKVAIDESFTNGDHKHDEGGAGRGDSGADSDPDDDDGDAAQKGRAEGGGCMTPASRPAVVATAVEPPEAVAAALLPSSKAEQGLVASDDGASAAAATGAANAPKKRTHGGAGELAALKAKLARLTDEKDNAAAALASAPGLMNGKADE